jgi:molybdopterin biosynthesis enzyme MoaB
MKDNHHSHTPALQHSNQIIVGIITISDRASAGDYDDLGGPALKQVAQKIGWQVLAKRLCPTRSHGFRKQFDRLPGKVAA